MKEFLSFLVRTLSALSVVFMSLSASQAQTNDRAASLLRQSLEAQGGEQKLRAIKNVQWDAFGYRNEVEESERPEGPYVTEFNTLSEIHDFSGNRYRTTTQLEIYPVVKVKTGTVVVDGVGMHLAGDRQMAGTAQEVELVHERVALNPDRVLLTALAASDVHAEADTVLQSVPQNVIGFTLDKAPVRIYLNAYTHLPTAVDYSGPLARSSYWAYMGDVTMRTYYSFWWLTKGGLHLPMQWNIERNGLAEEQVVIRKLRIDEALEEASLTIPAEVRAQFDPKAPAAGPATVPLGNPTAPAQELAPGIVFIPGPWNATLIRQDDGIVILEAPISPEYSAKVIAEAKRRFPEKPIKALITTSDSWPHIAGVREYVAQGIPIYALDLNHPILDRMIAAAHTENPDDLQRRPRRPQFRLVKEKMSLGTGTNRIEIYPLRGETSERQMMVYLPEHRLLYGSDSFQSQGDRFFFPQEVTELMDAVKREHLQVDRFFMMHIGPTSWSELGKAVSAAELQDTPDGTL
jgi:hypothetical protein